MTFWANLIVFLLFVSAFISIVAGLDALYQYGYEVWWRIKRVRSRRQNEVSRRQ